MADAHGTVWAVGERECSIQRRHQKIIEEAPSPLVERIAGHARQAVRGGPAGRRRRSATPARAPSSSWPTSDGDFFFLEMNTRLQVEHPVTEETTGLDLVELQLLVADGGRLDAEPPAARGHSIEARLYAEDPAKDWQPQAGPVHRFEVPDARDRVRHCSAAPACGVDSGVVDGSVGVGLLRPDAGQGHLLRADPRRRPRRSSPTRWPAPGCTASRTNRDLLVNVLRHPAFLDGATDTAFFDTHGLAELAAPLADRSAAALSAVAAALADAAAQPQRRNGARRRCPAAGATSRPATRPSGTSTRAGDEHEVRYRFTRAGLELAGARRRRAWCRRRRPGRAVASTASSDHSTSPATATTSSSTPRSGRSGSSRMPRFPDPDSAVAHGLAAGPDARLGDPGRRRRRRHGHRRASR